LLKNKDNKNGVDITLKNKGEENEKNSHGFFISAFYSTGGLCRKNWNCARGS
jgi:hypothetical protein